MGGFGAPDRGGSREGKKSLRGNKQALQKLVKDEQKGHVRTGPRPTVSEQPPPALPPVSDCPALVDAAAQLGSRQFDRDQFKVQQRAASSGVGPIVTYTTDDSKLEALARTAKENAGQVYCMLGVHSDNIKRPSDRLSPARLEQLKDLVLEPGCVAVMGGLAFRDVGTRYAQERALSEQMELAASVSLPLVLYEVRAAEALAERITEFRASGAGEGRAAVIPIAIFNFAGSEEELRAYLALGCHIVLTGRVCDPGERGDQLRQLAALIPLDHLMLASDSPFTTPQNIPDVFVREGRNEPSNLPYLLEALAPVLGLPPAELAAATRRNTLAFFGIREATAAEDADAAAAAGVSKAAGGVAASSGVSPAASGKSGGKVAAAAGAAAGPAAGPAGGKVGKAVRGGGKGQTVLGQQEHEQQEEDEHTDGDEEDSAEEDTEEEGAGRRGGQAASLFALMSLQEAEGEGEDQEEEEEKEEERGTQAHSDDATYKPSGKPNRPNRTRGEDADEPRGAVAAARVGAAEAVRSGVKPAPRNFVAEYEAAAAAKGPVSGPRVSYSCRSCRSVLFTEEDTVPHQDEERLLFAGSKPRKKGRGGKGSSKDNGESGLCSMHFLNRPLDWMQSCLQSEGPRLSEGKLVCPSCAAKLGKWAAGPGAEGVACSCGVVVQAPAYAVLRARLDILDAQLDIASAVQSTLRAYEEEAGASDGNTSSGDEGHAGGRKKRQKQKRNKTANFSSFRNKNFGFSVKQQRQLAESVTAAAGDGKATGQTGGEQDSD